MPTPRKVTVELIRKGSPHNQLLSPLAEYLGLCGDYGAAGITVPFQHHDLMHLLDQLLSYTYRGLAGKGSPSADRDYPHGFALQDFDVVTTIADQITKILTAVPGVLSELALGREEDGRLTELSLVFSASELAIIPFELARVPSEVRSGQTSWLQLQTKAPLCITRRIRGVSNKSFAWPCRPRVLLVAGGSPEFQIPLEPHIKAMLAAVRPWANTPEDASNILTILPQATLEDIQQACSQQTYTHVHLLVAHGEEDRQTLGSPYGVMLYKEAAINSFEIVSGSRVAAALRPFQGGRPAVVTIANCDTGKLSGYSSYGTAASFAHDLHQAGIPLVVASQYPLSLTGSILMVENLFRSLFWGEDPRFALHQIRARLYSQNPEGSYEWANLIAYAALPNDIESQLIEVRYKQAEAAITTAISNLDNVVSKIAIEESKAAKASANVTEIFARLDEAMARMPNREGYLDETLGVLAMTHLSKAEALYKLGNVGGLPIEPTYLRSVDELKKATSFSEKACAASMRTSATYRLRPLHWPICQYLSLRAVFAEPFNRDFWGAALISSQADLYESESEQYRAWAHATLAELYLLLLAYDEKELPENHLAAMLKALEHAQRIVLVAGVDSLETLSTKRQFERYIDWWGNSSFEAILNKSNVRRSTDWNKEDGLIALAKNILTILSRGLIASPRE
jgi:hypothetical protein